jgi:hypothetical protein
MPVGGGGAASGGLAGTRPECALMIVDCAVYEHGQRLDGPLDLAAARAQADRSAASSGLVSWSRVSRSSTPYGAGPLAELHDVLHDDLARRHGMP